MKMPVSILISVAVLVAGGIYIRMPRELSGAVFLSEFKRTSMNSTTSWYLYKITPEKYCMRKAAFPFDEYYCVSRGDVVIQNRNDGSSEPGFVSESDISLRRNGAVAPPRSKYR